MTDLCDNPEAEHECTESVRKAIEADAKSPEAWQTKARLHLIKSEFQEAKNDLDQSLSLWLPTYQAVLENRYNAIITILLSTLTRKSVGKSVILGQCTVLSN